MKTRIVNNREDAKHFFIAHHPNEFRGNHLNTLLSRIDKYPKHIAYCSDERTGRRFGTADCRSHLNPVKIGGTTFQYQIWMWDCEHN